MDQYQNFFPFTREAKVQGEFKEYLREYTNKKHISEERKKNLIRWLDDTLPKPQNQPEYSLRNYTCKTYRWDKETRILWGIGKPEKLEKPTKSGRRKGGWKGKGEIENESQDGQLPDRLVVTKDEILGVVEKIHMANQHGGVDATWNEISSKYCGIVRTDVIFLLKRCYICDLMPRKGARRTANRAGGASASSSSAAGPSSQQQQQFFGQQQAPKGQNFDQLLDQQAQATYDYGFGTDFGNDILQNDNFGNDFESNEFQDDFVQYGNYEGLGQLWNEEMPNIGYEDVSQQDVSYQDVSQQGAGYQDAGYQDFSHQDSSHQDFSHQDFSHQDFNQDFSQQDVDMTDISNIDPALLNDFSNSNYPDHTYTYPPPDEASGSGAYPYDFNFMQDSV
ncbi:hypothetical protein ACQKWADRAFT_313962 [Trichoderma austrokoningii]